MTGSEVGEYATFLLNARGERSFDRDNNTDLAEMTSSVFDSARLHLHLGFRANAAASRRGHNWRQP
jgi:hypothetical protein